jgi:hypothetical protein
MSATRPLVWRYASLRDQKPATVAASNSWLNTFFSPGPDIFAGETVKRTRLQMNLTFGWQNVTIGAGGDIEHPWYEGLQVTAGLYASPILASTGTPPAPVTDLSDGFWVQNDVLTVHQVVPYDSAFQHQAAEVIYKCDSGTNESFGQRGPYTVDIGTVFLAWEFEGFNTFWDSNDSEFFGWMGGQARWAVLVETAAS